MAKYCIILSFLLMQSCIHCYVINPRPEQYEIIDLTTLQNNDDNKPTYWQQPYMPVIEQTRENAWLKYLSDEFKRALNEDTTETTTKAQPEMYMEKTPQIYRESMMNMDDANMDMDRTKVKKSAQMNTERFTSNYPQSVNYINKQVDVRAPETVFVTFPEHTQIVDEFGRIILPTTAYFQPPTQKNTQEVENQMPEQLKESNQTEKKDKKKVSHKKENQEKQETSEHAKTDENKMKTERKTKTKHDKKEKHQKQSMSKQEQETQMKSFEDTTTSQIMQTGTKYEEEKEEEMTPATYTQNLSKYKTPLESTQNILLGRLNGPFTFGKNVI